MTRKSCGLFKARGGKLACRKTSKPRYSRYCAKTATGRCKVDRTRTVSRHVRRRLSAPRHRRAAPWADAPSYYYPPPWAAHAYQQPMAGWHPVQAPAAFSPVVQTQTGPFPAPIASFPVAGHTGPPIGQPPVSNPAGPPVRPPVAAGSVVAPPGPKHVQFKEPSVSSRRKRIPQHLTSPYGRRRRDSTRFYNVKRHGAGTEDIQYDTTAGMKPSNNWPFYDIAY